MQNIDSPRTPADTRPLSQGGASGGTSSTPSRAGAPARAKRRHTFWWYLKWIFITIQLVLFCAIVVTVSIGYGLYNRLSEIVPDVRFMTTRAKAEPTRIFATDGSLLAELKGEEREWVRIDDLKLWRKRNGVSRQEPGRLISATLSIEDARFYTHPGMDAKRIIGAALANYRSGGIAQGGSTITEQLAKNVYLTRTKTFSRRLQTALLALQLERRFTKDEILELYLNEIYYGNRAYGCEAAAHTYFNKHAKDLSIAEASFLAGLPQQPSNLDPFDHFDRAKNRQRIVLHEMLQNQAINYQQYLEAIKDTSLSGKIYQAKQRFLASHKEAEHWRYPYFVSYVLSYLHRQGWTDEYLHKSGLKIYTTLDPKMQDAAEDVMTRQMNYHSKKLEGSLVCIDPWTGHVLAMYGGRDYYDKQHGQWNRAVQAKRQPGSTMKPYIYATAMQMGYTPDSTVVDKPLKVWGHEIKNYDFRHRGAMTFRSAIGMSNNVAATRVLMKIGIPNVVQQAHLMGIQSSLVPVPTLALGTSEISLLEHVSAYGVFATRGLRAEPTPVERVENYAGETLMEHSHPVRGARVLSVGAGNEMWDMLRYVVTNGTGKPAAISGVDVIGKTGTTSSNKDVWFMGATRQLVAGVWLGYDRPSELYGSSGGKWSAPAWREFMVRALDIWSKRNQVEKLVEDARATAERKQLASQFAKYVRVRICNESGLLATASCPSTHIEEFSAAGGAPTQYCDIHPNKAQTDRPLGDHNDGAGNNPGDLGYDPGAAAGGRGDEGSKPAGADDYGRDAGNADPGNPAAGVDDGPGAGNGAGGGATGEPPLARRSHISYRPPRGGAPPVSPIMDAPADTSGAGDEVVATVCAESGDLATSRCPVTVQRFYMAADVPRRHCRLHH